MIFTALTALGIPQRLLKPVAYIGGALLIIALLAGLWLWIDAREEADDKVNQEIGASGQRETDLRTTLERTEDANKARDDVRSDVDGARYAQCLRTARTPANCKRFLPGGEADQR